MNVEGYINDYFSVFVARTDFYWDYLPNGMPYLKKRNGKTVQITRDKVRQVLRGKETIGLSPFVTATKVLYGIIDIDAHTSSDETFAETARKQMDARRRRDKYIDYLTKNGYLFMVNSSGSEDGWHIRIYSNDIIEAYIMRGFMKYMQLKLFGKLEDEIYPKQDALRDDAPYGSQVKGPLSVHPKHGTLALLYDYGRILSREESIKYIADFYPRINHAKPIQFDLPKIDRPKPNINPNKDRTTPSFCPVIEDWMTKYSFPSSGVTRHHYLDPNVNIYTWNKPQTRIKYLKAQDRNEDSLRNWTRRHPYFECGQIKSYLYHHRHHPTVKKCIKECTNCPCNFLTNK